MKNSKIISLAAVGMLLLAFGFQSHSTQNSSPTVTSCSGCKWPAETGHALFSVEQPPQPQSLASDEEEPR